MISRSNGKSKSEKFPPPHEDGAVVFPMEPKGKGHPSLRTKVEVFHPLSYVPWFVS